MTGWLSNFNYAEYKAAFRAAAKRHKIDLESGATSYQVALVKAEMTQHKRIDFGKYVVVDQPVAINGVIYNWREAIVEDGLTERVPRVTEIVSSMEIEAEARASKPSEQMFAAPDEVPFDGLTVLELLREVLAETKREQMVQMAMNLE